MNYTADDFDTSAKTDEILCDLQRTSSSNMNSESDYEFLDSRRMLQPPRNGGGMGGGGREKLGTASGIALSGGYIFNALDG